MKLIDGTPSRVVGAEIVLATRQLPDDSGNWIVLCNRGTANKRYVTWQWSVLGPLLRFQDRSREAVMPKRAFYESAFERDWALAR